MVLPLKDTELRTFCPWGCPAGSLQLLQQLTSSRPVCPFPTWHMAWARSSEWEFHTAKFPLICALGDFRAGKEGPLQRWFDPPSVSVLPWLLQRPSCHPTWPEVWERELHSWAQQERQKVSQSCKSIVCIIYPNFEGPSLGNTHTSGCPHKLASLPCWWELKKDCSFSVLNCFFQVNSLALSCFPG